MDRFFVLSVTYVSRDLDHAWLLTVPNVLLRQILVFQVSILKREAFLFPLTPFFVVKIDVSSLKEHRKELRFAQTLLCALITPGADGIRKQGV